MSNTDGENILSQITVLQISIMDTPLAPDMDREREMMMELQVGRVELEKVEYKKYNIIRRQP